MRRDQTDTVRDVAAEEEREVDATKPPRRLPTPPRATTKQMHERLLRVMGDRRFRRR